LNALGIQLIVDLKECNPKLLNDLSYIRETLREVVQHLGAHAVGETFHQFSPQGITGVIAIAESHIAIHTWPEHNYAAVDIFTCGTELMPQKAVPLLVVRLESKQPSIVEVRRGVLPVPVPVRR
jgi:S-adenosylmethionine decarboxylase